MFTNENVNIVTDCGEHCVLSLQQSTRGKFVDVLAAQIKNLLAWTVFGTICKHGVFHQQSKQSSIVFGHNFMSAKSYNSVMFASR